MDGILAGADEARGCDGAVDVHEVGVERMRQVVGEPEAQKLAVERHQTVDRSDALHVEHDMAEAERPGAKAEIERPGTKRSDVVSAP